MSNSVIFKIDTTIFVIFNNVISDNVMTDSVISFLVVTWDAVTRNVTTFSEMFKFVMFLSCLY